jgi:nicotinamidase-related amidase
MDDFEIDTATTALVLIDLQTRIVAMPTAPYSGKDVVENAGRLHAAFRAAGASVVIVQVSRPGAGNAEGTELVPEATPEEGDLLITKQTIGAFYKTALDDELKARGVKTLVFGGIATEFGVESTLRAAGDHGYATVAVSDAMTGLTAGAHESSITNVFPRFGEVRTTLEIVQSLSGSAV